MSGPLELFLPMRYFRPKRNLFSILTILSILGPIIGVAVLVVVTGVMSGFDREIKSRFMNMQAHITLVPRGLEVIPLRNSYLRQLNKNPDFQASPLIQSPILLQSVKETTPQILIGIDPRREKAVSDLDKKIYDGAFQLNDGEVLIGTSLANKHRLRVGSKFMVHSLKKLGQNIDFTGPDGPQMVSDPILSLPNELTVTGIFEFGLHEFDAECIVVNMNTAADISDFPLGSATALKVMVPDGMQASKYLPQLREAFPELWPQSWMDRNRQLFATIEMEKRLMFFLLSFIVAVASLGVVGTLLTFAIQKTKEIGVLKALGATPAQVLRIFLVMGVQIGLVGTTLGTALGVFILHHRQSVADFLSKLKGDEVFPPELYHLTRIPGEIDGAEIALIYFVALGLCVGASMLPALFAAYSSPAKALKSDEIL